MRAARSRRQAQGINEAPLPERRRGASFVFGHFDGGRHDAPTDTDRPERDSASSGRIAAPAIQGGPAPFGARAAARAAGRSRSTTFDRLLAALAAGEIDVAVLPAVTRHRPGRRAARGARASPRRRRGRSPSSRDRGPGAPRPRGAARRRRRGRSRRSTRSRRSSGSARGFSRGCDAASVETHDTAFAARRVAELGGARAAVCSEEAALEAGLVVLEEDVSDVKPNATRFWRRRAAGGARGSSRRVRALLFPAARLAAALADAGAEILTLPGGRRDGPRVRDRPARRSSRRPRPRSAQSKARGSSGSVPRPTTRRRRDSGSCRARRRSARHRRHGRRAFAVGGGGPRGHRGPVRGRVARAGHAPREGRRARRRDGAPRRRLQAADLPRTPSRGTASRRSDWLKAAGDAVGLPIVTEVMAPAQVGPVAELADVLQIGARNCQNYDLLKEAGRRGPAGPPEARLRDDGRRVALLGRVPPRRGLRRRDALRAGDPDVREGDARHARPRRPPRGAVR